MQDEQEELWVEIGRFGARIELQQRVLVLNAAGIDHRLIRDEINGWIGVFVAVPDVALARHEMAEFEKENRRPYPQVSPDRPWREGLPAALSYGVVLMLFFVLSHSQTLTLDWFSAGAAQAGLIAEGEWWRVITALGLHVDIAHIVANGVAGGLFGLFLAQSLGAGLTWLALLLAGGSGNAINALLQSPDHTSVGASTAVFAALGLLAVTSLQRPARLLQTGLRRWLPLAAGVALLGFLGFSGVRTDVGAHIAGFVAGCGFGAAFVATGRILPKGETTQRLLGATTVALFVGAWVLALSKFGA